MVEVQPIDGINYKRILTGSRRVWPGSIYGVDIRLTQSKGNWSVKVVMDCIYEAEIGIDIVKLMVSDSTHRISVVHASINRKRCITGQYDMKNQRRYQGKILLANKCI